MSATRFTAHPAGSSDLDTVVRVSIMAFSDEAVIAWAIPNAVDRHAYMRDTFSSLLQSAVDAGAVILARDSGGTAVAASIWVPSRGSATADASARQTSDPRATEAYPDDPIKRRLEHVEAATRARTPPEEHMHLSAMATLLSSRGRGAGTVMVTAGLARARAHGLPVYLEASTVANRRLYARLGFHDLGDAIVLPDGGPALQPMWLEHSASRS